jgi:hypothetical protein
MERKIKRMPKFKTNGTSGNFELRTTPRTTSIFSVSNRVEIEFDPGIEAPAKSISLRLPREMLNQLKVLAK